MHAHVCPVSRAARALRLAITALVVALVAGCATHNTTREGGDDALMLLGLDPVSYFQPGGPVAGDRSIKLVRDGVTYRFASAANRAEFEKNPERYTPKYEGFCANGLVYAVKLGGNARLHRIIDDRLYIFGDASSRDYFEMDRAKNVQLADYYWTSEARGTAWRWQSAKRLLFKVPHYKTGRELADELERRRAGTPRG